MKKFFILCMLSSVGVMAFDMGAVTDSVNKEKAMNSVDTEKAMAAASKGTDIKMKDVTGSVDGDKAIDSVDKEKLMKSLF